MRHQIMARDKNNEQKKERNRGSVHAFFPFSIFMSPLTSQDQRVSRKIVLF